MDDNYRDIQKEKEGNMMCKPHALERFGKVKRKTLHCRTHKHLIRGTLRTSCTRRRFGICFSLGLLFGRLLFFFMSFPFGLVLLVLPPGWHTSWLVCTYKKGHYDRFFSETWHLWEGVGSFFPLHTQLSVIYPLVERGDTIHLPFLGGSSCSGGVNSFE